MGEDLWLRGDEPGRIVGSEVKAGGGPIAEGEEGEEGREGVDWDGRLFASGLNLDMSWFILELLGYDL